MQWMYQGSELTRGVVPGVLLEETAGSYICK